jgi:hypothetical protein
MSLQALGEQAGRLLGLWCKGTFDVFESWRPPSGKPQLYYCAPMIVNKPKLRTMVHEWHIIVQDRHNEPNGPFYTMVEKPIENGASFSTICIIGHY